MIKTIFEKLLSKNDLTIDDSSLLMSEIMNGNLSNSLISAILTSFRFKGVTAKEIAGFVKTMRTNSLNINSDDTDAIDVCGTGGDKSGTFNISTAVAFVVAGAGIKVAKHGNRSISSKSGSADVLNQLGVNINLSPKNSEKALSEIGITFLFAQQYHPSMKFVGQVRKELGIKTIFNLLGPLTNPANVNKQLIGTYNNETAKILAEAAEYLAYERICFVCCENKYDEILLNGVTDVFEYNKDEGIKNYKISNETFNYDKVELSEIKGDDAKTNAKIIRDIFTGEKNDAVFTTIVANASLALYSAKYSYDLIKCKNAAEKSLLSGAANNKLDKLIKFCKSIK